MVELIRAAALHDRDLVDHLRQVRQHLGEFCPALAMLGERKAWPQHSRVGADEGIPLPPDDLGGIGLPSIFARAGL